MREKVRAFMEQYHMVTAGERVLLGLSGETGSWRRYRAARIPSACFICCGNCRSRLAFRCWLSTSTITCAARKPGGMRHLQKICAGNMMFRSISIPVPWRRSQKKSISRRRRRDARRGRKFLQRVQRSRGQ